MGRLRQCLQSGEYGELRECAMLEGEFLQVTRSGDAVSFVAVGAAAPNRDGGEPELLLLAAATGGRPRGDVRLLASVTAP
ncbi:protein FAM71E1-like [Phasianus colchicus]|uniref:protein FAM71E1-like n=1 Tax=Phasianus colchicus TaxID=9054 RepID=UPI00129E5A71|nr:protein FAM71E1-like [Phasianus colchicus]